MTQTDTPPHVFDTAISLTDTDGNRLRGSTRPEYANMVGPFGGLTAGTLVHAIQRHPDSLGDPLALTVNYTAPVNEGTFDIVAQPVHTNRSNQHWSLELTQNGSLKTTGTAVSGYRRDTWSDTEVEMPPALSPEEVAPQDLPDFIAWAHNYDMRFIEGAVPTDDAGEHPTSTTSLWVRDSPARPLDYPALTALCDVFYPRVFLRRGRYLPAGTVSFTVYFHTDADGLTAVGDDFVLATGRAQSFSRGHFDQSAQIWSRAGALLATSHQLVYYKD